MISIFAFFNLPPRSLLAATLLDGAALLIYISAYVIFRITHNHRIAANIIIFFLVVIVFVGITITGGFVKSPISQLVILIPLNGYLLLGRRDGWRWMLIAIVTCVCFYVLTLHNMIFFVEWLDPDQQTLMGITLRFVTLVMVGGTLVIYEHITESLNRRLSTERNKFAHQASHDELTQIPNRMEFSHRLDAGIIDCEQREEKLAVLYIDLNDFKPINDQYGHHTGDQLLQAVGKSLSSTVRRSDTVARLGGDEFAIILTGIRNIDDATSIAKKLAQAVLVSIEVDGITITANASIGIALYPDDAKDSETLCKLADRAMYQAKSDQRTFLFHQQLAL